MRWSFLLLIIILKKQYIQWILLIKKTIDLDFSFGTFYHGFLGAWYHYQLTSGYTEYEFRKEYTQNGNKNGTRLVINSYGDDGTNSGSWNYEYYKF